MKNVITAVILLFVYTTQVSGQNPYYDALALDALPGTTQMSDGRLVFDQAQAKEVTEILKKYVADAQDYRTIYFAFKPNPFCGPGGNDNMSTGLVDISSITSLFQKTSSIGGLNVTTAVEGISQFMITRAKEELTIAFFERFRKCVEANPELQVMFPTTTTTLINLLSYQYPEMLPALRTAFYDDLKLLPVHVDDVLELPKYRELLINFPEVRIAIHLIRICNQLESPDIHPHDIIDEIAALQEWEDQAASVGLQNMGNSIRLGDLISKSLSGDSTAWVSASELQMLIRKNTAFRIYLGLIFQQVTHIKLFFPNAASDEITFTRRDGSVILFSEIMRANKNNLILFQSKFTEFIQVTEKLKATLRAAKSNGGQAPDKYYNYIIRGIDVIEYAFGFAKIFDKEFVRDDYIKIARSASELYRNIYIKEYTAGLLNAVDILKEVQAISSQNSVAIKNANDRLLDVIKSIDTTAIQNSDVKKIISQTSKSAILSDKELEALQKNVSAIPKLTLDQKLTIDGGRINPTLENLLNVIPEISKYGLFIANIASAETADEVAKIIEAAVLPVGSSSIKKNSQWNMSVQSYLGAYWRTGGTKSTVERAWDDRFGVIAPIGLSVSYGFEKWGSVSAFVPLIDLGAMVDYQLKYDTLANSSSNDVQVSKDYEIELGQIFSPGGYVVYGFGGNLPLSFGFGGQYGPGLNKIDDEGGTVVDNPHWRWNVFLAVDIPFFNIFNKERKTSMQKK